ncbi:hypothetical protein NUV25_11825 [Burkholderia pseudomultivorans]|uniref:hypothetical protein n=1 Tax=Burkholderia pseudomultivorans TaxID=1207504 RepID=UPI0009C086CE|nr:hypothetical protein [Burkholderia pseudomultivorans]MDS0858398.1 hypothetical protein [Burkholderia pseudomultivorans]
MKKILLKSTAGFVSYWLLFSSTMATSVGPIHLDIKQIDDKPAACLPAGDDAGPDSIRIRGVGVSRATGTVSPDVIYWDLDVPENAQPVYLKRGECLVYGQTVAGALVHTPAKTLDANKYYGFSIIPAGDDAGPVYSSTFCVLKPAGGRVRIAAPARGQNPCGSLGF